MARYFGVPMRNGLPIGLGSSLALGRPSGPPAPIPDDYFEYTTLLLPGNGTNGAQNNTFLDSSTNAFSITRNGNTTQGTFSPFSQTGWGNYFDGSGDYLSVNYTATNFGTSDFTVEAWVYPTARGASPVVLLDTRASGTSNPFVFGLTATNGYLYYYNGSVENASTTTVTLNAWSHIAISRSGTTARLFVNGVQALSVTDSSNLTGTSTGSVRIGVDAAGGSALTGYLSNFRVVKGTAVYTANFTPSTTPLTAITNTSLLTCQSNRFVDNSSNAFAITRNGDVSVQAFSPFNPTAAWSAATYGGSGYFDGSGDYLQYASNAAFQFGTGDFTIEFWWYPTTLASAQVLVYHTDDSGVVGVGEFVIVYNTSVGLRFYINNNQVDVQQGSTSGWSANSWYHIAAVRNGNTLTLYRNGTSIASGSVSGVTIGAAVVTQLMGETYDPLYSTGYFSNYRVVKGTAVYTAAFTPPSAPLTAITNTSLLLNYTNAGIYDATSKNDLETVGNAQISTTQSKFGGSSMYFDGTGDYLSAKNNPALQLGSGDFTVEFWLYANSSSANHGLVASDQTGSGYWAILIASNTIYWQNVNGSSNLFSTSYSSYYNQWVHVAFVRYSGTTKLYLNGAYIAGAADSSNYNGAAGAYDVGRDVDNGAYLTGYINDLRVTKGIARYTSNFTPPTTAFPVL